MTVTCPLWYPVYLSAQTGTAPIPFVVWCAWHVANARTLEQSRRAMDPFPSEVIA